MRRVGLGQRRLLQTSIDIDSTSVFNIEMWRWLGWCASIFLVKCSVVLLSPFQDQRGCKTRSTNGSIVRLAKLLQDYANESTSSSYDWQQTSLACIDPFTGDVNMWEWQMSTATSPSFTRPRMVSWHMTFSTPVSMVDHKSAIGSWPILWICRWNT